MDLGCMVAEVLQYHHRDRLPPLVVVQVLLQAPRVRFRWVCLGCRTLLQDKTYNDRDKYESVPLDLVSLLRKSTQLDLALQRVLKIS